LSLWHYVLGSLLVLLLALGGTWLVQQRQPPKAIDTLAILPFATQGDHPQLEILADAIPDNLISRLSPLLHVIARSTSFRFSPDSDASEVGQALDVRAVVFGRLTAAGGSFSASVELVDTGSHRQLWGKQYPNRSLKEILDDQNQLTSEIAAALQLNLTAEENTRLAKRGSVNQEAYFAYQEGRRVWETGDNPGIAREHFQAAVAADPGYAPAYAALAQIYVSAVFRGAAPLRELTRSIEEFAKRALDLDPDLAPAHCALGWVRAFQADWAGAEESFRRAITRNPGLPDGHQAMAMALLAPQGRVNEAITAMKQALLLDPESALRSYWLGRLYEVARLEGEAIGQFRRALELDPHLWTAHRSLGFALARKGQRAEALEAFRHAAPEDCPGCLAPEDDPKALLSLGNRQAAIEAMEKLDLAKYPWKQAMLHADLGRADDAFQILRETLQDPNRYYGVTDELWLKVSLMWDPIRNDPRFAELLRLKGLEPNSYR
jgi:TolB-like protein